MNSKIKQKIHALEEIEYNSVSSFEQDLEKDGFAKILNDPKKLVSCYLLADKANEASGKEKKFSLISNSDYNPIDEAEEADVRVEKNWANACDQIPILRQLLTDPYLLVDLRACNEKECIEHYGLKPSQLKELAERGYIFFNLYEYESDKVETNQKEKFGKYSSQDWLEELIDSRYTKITSIRKKAFFDRMNKHSSNTSFEELVEEGKHHFKKAILEESRPDLLISMNERNIIRNTDANEVLETVAQQFAYVKSCQLGEKNDDLRYLLSQSLDEITEKESALVFNIEKKILQIRGLKNLAATRYTASMGGVYNMSKGAANAFMEINEGFSGSKGNLEDEKRNDRMFIEGNPAGFLEVLEDHGLNKKQGLSLFNGSKIMYNRKAPTDKQFHSYLEFLDRVDSLRIDLSNYLHYINSDEFNGDYSSGRKNFVGLKMEAKAKVYAGLLKFATTMEFYDPNNFMIIGNKADDVNGLAGLSEPSGIVDGFYNIGYDFIDNALPIFTSVGFVYGSWNRLRKNHKKFLENDPRRFLLNIA